MNLVQFLKKVDNKASAMTKEQLQSYVHELARTLPESRRYYFLETMDMISEKGSLLKRQSDNYYHNLCSEMKEIEDVLTSINNEERCLDSEYNPEWDDWYNSDVDEVLFSDPEGIIPDIEKGINFLHKCVDMEAYKEGCEVAELLSALKVGAVGDYNECDGTPLGIQELYEHNLLKGTFKKVVEESLYLSYMGNEAAVRAEELYYMMDNYECYEVTLEDIMQVGTQDLPEFKEFLLLWIDYLGGRNGRGGRLLLKEALAMLEDDEQILDIARKYEKQHPELYKQLLKKGLKGEAWSEMLQIGMEALEKIPVSYILRSEIALLTAVFANRLKDSEKAEFCWMEAFRSDTSVENYLRIRLLTKNWKRYSGQVKQIYEEVYRKTKQERKTYMLSSYENMQRENSLEHNTYCALLFFDRDYETVIRLGLSEKNALGWSSTFMKQGLALFLLLLYKGETLTKGLESMLEEAVYGIGFKAEKFLKGTDLNNKAGEKEIFWELLCQWKKETELAEDTCSKWMELIERYVSVRTVGIMEANRRSYYGECAAFIAAYGEVCESRGTMGAKDAIMEKYRAEYSRRRAFHQELRNYGMKK